MPPLAEPCDCMAPRVMCETTGDGRLRQECLGCGAVNLVERRLVRKP